MENTIVANVQAEIMSIGCIYKNPELLLEVEKVINSEYYYSDPVTKFLYNSATILYNREQKFTEKSVTVFMSEEEDRLAKFRSFGGYSVVQSFIDLVDLDNFNSYFEELKKFALCREMEAKGFNTEKIRSSKKFQIATANDIYYHIKGIVDNVHTNILTQVEIDYITNNMNGLIMGYLETPSMGAQTPFSTFNNLFRGFRTKTHFSLGMISNAGKTRLLVRLAAYNAIIQKNKTMLLLNEMSAEEVKIALLVTCINNQEFKPLHGIDIEKCEREISLGLYKDSNGEFIYREKDEFGDFIENVEDYHLRLMMNSREYRDVLLVSAWIEENGGNNLAVIDVSGRYDDKSLETQIRKNCRLGFKYIFYDTLKSDMDAIGDWGQFKKTATLLTELAKNEDVFLYSSIQLTDDSENVAPLDLNSNVIANAKQIRHVLDSLVLCKEIEPDQAKKYMYYSTEKGYGENTKMALPLPECGGSDKLYAFVVSKNRAGEKRKILVKVNLDTNCWDSIGYVVKK